MRFGKVIAVMAASAAMTGAAYAWTSDVNGKIKCADGSGATVVEVIGGLWTVTQAGTHGTAGGRYAGQNAAASAACGEQ